MVQTVAAAKKEELLFQFRIIVDFIFIVISLNKMLVFRFNIFIVFKEIIQNLKCLKKSRH